MASAYLGLRCVFGFDWIALPICLSTDLHCFWWSWAWQAAASPAWVWRWPRPFACPLIEGDDHHSPASRAKMSEGIALTDADGKAGSPRWASCCRRTRKARC